jgi:hypothetical protein
MTRPALHLTDHAVRRWVQRTGEPASALPAAWQASIYQGWLRRRPARRRASLPFYGYRWRAWVLVVVYRPPHLTRGARRTWPVGYTLATCWPLAWWERALAQAEQDGTPDEDKEG